jgi:Arc/MetJ-type ribon-helix-helix transcriptional regulator
MNKKVNWNIPVTKLLDEAVELVVKKEIYSTKSGLVRDSVRRRLEELGYKSKFFTENTPTSKKKSRERVND